MPRLKQGGRVTYNPLNKELVLFPTFSQRYAFTDDITEQSEKKEGLNISVGGISVQEDVAVSVYFNSAPDRIKGYYGTYRSDPEEFVQTRLRDELRGCFNRVVDEAKITTPAAYQSKRIGSVSKVVDCLSTSFPFLVIENVELIGKPGYPPNIQASIDEQFQAEQAAKTAEASKRQAEAEAATKLTQAKGDVEAEKVRASLANNPNYLKYRELNIEEKRAEKWNGEYAPIIQSPNVQLGTTQAE